jgi:hypothetical protein
MNEEEQATYDWTLANFGPDAAEAWENTCAQARREEKRIPSETIELQTVSIVDGKYVTTTIETMSHDEYNGCIQECEESDDFDPMNEMPWAIIGGKRYNLPIADPWDTHITVEKVQ